VGSPAPSPSPGRASSSRLVLGKRDSAARCKPGGGGRRGGGGNGRFPQSGAGPGAAVPGEAGLPHSAGRKAGPGGSPAQRGAGPPAPAAKKRLGARRRRHGERSVGLRFPRGLRESWRSARLLEALPALDVSAQGRALTTFLDFSRPVFSLSIFITSYLPCS